MNDCDDVTVAAPREAALPGERITRAGPGYIRDGEPVHGEPGKWPGSRIVEGRR